MNKAIIIICFLALNLIGGCAYQQSWGEALSPDSFSISAWTEKEKYDGFGSGRGTGIGFDLTWNLD